MQIQRVAVPAISFGQHPGLVKLLLDTFPNCKINTEGIPYHRSEDETIDYLKSYEAAIVSFEPINERVLSALPKLRVVSKLGFGVDKIDPAAMKRHGVRLGWTPGVNKRSVAELALCMALAGLRHVMRLNGAMRRGERPVQMGRQYFIATPHIGASSEEARWRTGTTAIEGLTDNFLPEPGQQPFEGR